MYSEAMLFGPSIVFDPDNPPDINTDTPKRRKLDDLPSMPDGQQADVFRRPLPVARDPMVHTKYSPPDRDPMVHTKPSPPARDPTVWWKTVDSKPVPKAAVVSNPVPKNWWEAPI